MEQIEVEKGKQKMLLIFSKTAETKKNKRKHCRKHEKNLTKIAYLHWSFA